MNKKTTIIVFALVIAAAIFMGFLFLNKGDGPVAGMILSDSIIENTEEYGEAAKNPANGTYLVVSNAFNKYQEDFLADIPGGVDIYAAVHFVECPKGSVFIGKWIYDGNVVAEKEKTLMTGPTGVISFMLDGTNANAGSCIFELYQENNKIFEKEFDIK